MLSRPNFHARPSGDDYDTMTKSYLPCLAGGRTDISLSILVCNVIHDLVHFRWQFAAGHLQAKHKLEGLGVGHLVSPLKIAVLLHVASMVLEDDDSLISKIDPFLVIHFLRSIKK